jgi:hypothetical protein
LGGILSDNKKSSETPQSVELKEQEENLEEEISEEEMEEGAEEEEEEVAVAEGQGQAVVVVQHKEPEPEKPKREPVTPIQLKPNSDQAEAWRDVLKILEDLDIEEVTFNENGNVTVHGATDLQTFKMNGFRASGKDGKATYSSALLQVLSKKDWHTEYTNDMPMKAHTTITKSTYEYPAKGEPIRHTTKIANINVYLAPRIEIE